MASRVQASAGWGPLGLGVPGGGGCCSPSPAGVRLGAARKNSPAVVLTLTREWSRCTETDYLERTRPHAKGANQGKEDQGPRPFPPARVYLLISRNALTNLWGCEATSGVLPRVWLVWPSLQLRVGMGSCPSPQAPVTPGNLSDPRAEDAREAEGSGEKEQTLGIWGTHGTLWAPNSVFIANT